MLIHRAYMDVILYATLGGAKVTLISILLFMRGKRINVIFSFDNRNVSISQPLLLFKRRRISPQRTDRTSVSDFHTTLTPLSHKLSTIYILKSHLDDDMTTKLNKSLCSHRFKHTQHHPPSFCWAETTSLPPPPSFHTEWIHKWHEQFQRFTHPTLLSGSAVMPAVTIPSF